MTAIANAMSILSDAVAVELHGTVREVRGLALRVADLPVPVGAGVRIQCLGGRRHVAGEVVGFDADESIVMPLGSTDGISRGDVVVAEQFERFAHVGDTLLGRVLNGFGQPIDGKGPLRETMVKPIGGQPIDPLDRPLIDQPLATGVRAIDGLHSVGRGQRLGVFAAPGLGKSTLLGMMARHTDADVSVIALVGERGREVRDFIENHLGEEGLARSVVICATGDESALLRIRCALVANTIAEYFRDGGRDVLLMMDSVTRFCQAQRQVGLAAGEPPATRGYPPSVFTLLPNILERSGRTTRGTITGFYAVLVEGDELTDPIADAARGILDGHIQLSSKYADRGHWPAIDPVTSISRVADQVTTPQHQEAATLIKQLVHSYDDVEDLLNIGAYATGSNPEFDLAIACKPAIDQFLQQGRGNADAAQFERTCNTLTTLAATIQQQRQKLSPKRPPHSGQQQRT